MKCSLPLPGRTSHQELCERFLRQLWLGWAFPELMAVSWSCFGVKKMISASVFVLNQPLKCEQGGFSSPGLKVELRAVCSWPQTPFLFCMNQKLRGVWECWQLQTCGGISAMARGFGLLCLPLRRIGCREKPTRDTSEEAPAPQGSPGSAGFWVRSVGSSGGGLEVVPWGDWPGTETAQSGENKADFY